MAKKIWKGAALLNPVPVVLVSLGERKENYNIITIAWTGTTCSEPHGIKRRTVAFAISK